MSSSTLHTINKSPFATHHLQSCLSVAQANQAIVLLEDGIYGLLANNPCYTRLIAFIQAGGKVYALQHDIDARGLSEHTTPHIQGINHSEFVDLCCKHNPIQSWY